MGKVTVTYTDQGVQEFENITRFESTQSDYVLTYPSGNKLFLPKSNIYVLKVKDLKC